MRFWGGRGGGNRVCNKESNKESNKVIKKKGEGVFLVFWDFVVVFVGLFFSLKFSFEKNGF